MRSPGTGNVHDRRRAPRRRGRGAALAIAALVAGLGAGGAAAQQGSDTQSLERRLGLTSSKEPVLFKSDELHYDESKSLVTATGHVEVSRGSRVVLADRVTYDRKTGIVTAEGHVSMVQADGSVVFADRAELTEDMREAVAEKVAVLLKDKSRFAAASAEHSAGEVTVLHKAVYSPCELCKADPTRPPVWQMKAAKVIHDSKEHEVEYRDATLEFFGVPVLYSPYFSHPDPTVQRRSGFLAPTYGNDSQLGYTLRTPYYQTFGPNSDATFTPMIMSKQGLILDTDYRHLFEHGQIETRVTGGWLDRQENNIDRGWHMRGHFRSRGEFDLGEYFRTTFDVSRASDQTYLRTFGFDSSAALRSKVLLEGFDERSYLSLGAQTSQELRTNVPNRDTPTAFPDAYASWVSEPDSAGATWSADTSVLALLRPTGTQSRRIAVRGKYERPLTTDGGHKFDFAATIRADGYSVVDAPNPAGASLPSFNGEVARVFPQATADWRYPLIRPTGSGAIFVEPHVGLVLSTPAPNPSDIPNEDSQDAELDIDNLFRPNRFPGWDRIEGGERVNYGFTVGYYEPSIGQVTGAIGQSYRTTRDTSFPIGSGLRDKLSDVVGGITVSPNSVLDLRYRFRVDPEKFQFQRQEIGMSAGWPLLRLDLDFARLHAIDTEGLGTDFQKRTQINFRLKSHFAEHWFAFYRQRYDFEDNKMLVSQAGIRYADECMLIEGLFTRSLTNDPELDQKNAFIVRLVLRNFGEDYAKRPFGEPWR